MNTDYVYDSSVKQNKLLTELKDLYRYRALVFDLTMRNVTVRYKRSFLGTIWTALDPLLTMVVMYLVFSQILVRRVEDFPVYLLSGLVVWNFFSQATNGAIKEFSSSGRLISRVYLPQSIFVIVAILSSLVNFAISLVELFLIIIITGHPINLTFVEIVIPLLILVAFSLGLSLILAPLEIFFSDVSNFYQIGLRLLLYMSAIMYQIEHLPVEIANIVLLNPIYRFISLFRDPVYLGNHISFDSLIYVSIWAAILLIGGTIFFIRAANRVAMKV